MNWVVLRVEVDVDDAEGVTNLLFEAGAGGVITEVSDAEIPPPPPGRAILETHVPAFDRWRVVAAVDRYAERLGGAVAITTSLLPTEDWVQSFRLHHRPLAVGARLLIAPPWDAPVADGRVRIVVEPGMAFGTGQHATTRTCLEEIESLVDGGAVQTALDVGTGSGVLAAALAGLGVPRVVAIDTDPAVLPIARATLRRNHATRVLLAAASPAAVRGGFDLVVANLLADALIDEAQALAAAVGLEGHLIVSGVLDSQVAAVLDAYRDWRVVAERAEDRWRTLRLARSRPVVRRSRSTARTGP